MRFTLHSKPIDETLSHPLRTEDSRATFPRRSVAILSPTSDSSDDLTALQLKGKMKMRYGAQRLLLVLLVGTMLLAGCARAPMEDAAGSPAQLAAAVEAYRAYERRDCDDVMDRAESLRIDSWDPTEYRDSFRLLDGFCHELEGDGQRARQIYRAIVREAPLSFASDDARERLRVLRLLESDPDYPRWVENARRRATTGSSTRAALERAPASFPPLAASAAINGYVVIEFGITPRGVTDAPVIVASEPPLVFDGAALRAVRSWRYEREAGGTESQRQAIRLVFKPDSQEAVKGEAEPSPR